MSLGQALANKTETKKLKYQSVNFANSLFQKPGTPFPSFSEGEKVDFLINDVS